MSEDAKGEVRIDRLVLDIPGFDAAQAHALARGIAEGLAKMGGEGSLGLVSLQLEEGGSTEDLAARVVAALAERLV